MPLPPEFRVTESGDTLRIAWCNHEVAKDGCGTAFLIAFWLVWTPLTVGVTAWALVDLFGPPFQLGVFCVAAPCGLPLGFLAWYGVFAVPHALMRRRWGEAITISPDAITHTRTGWLAPMPDVYPLHRVSDFALGWYQNGPSATAHHSVQVGLYVSMKDKWGGHVAHPVGERLSEELKEGVFDVVRRFVADRRLALNATVWGELPRDRIARLRVEVLHPVQLPHAFRVTETDGTLRVEWDNRRVPKQANGPPLGVFVFFMAAGAVLWTFKLVQELTAPRELRDAEGIAVSAINLPVWCAFALILGYVWLQRTWAECVELGRDALTITRTGWLAPNAAVYPLAAVEKLTLAWNGITVSGYDSDASDAVGVLIHRPGKCGPDTSQLAWWLSDTVKYHLYRTLRDFAVRNDIPLAFDEWGTRPAWAQPNGSS